MRKSLHFIFDSIWIICLLVLSLNNFTKYIDLSEKYETLLFCKRKRLPYITFM